VNDPERRREDMLDDLRAFATARGRAPSYREWDRERHTTLPSSYTGARYRQVFGTWNKAISAAGLKPANLIAAPLSERGSLDAA
jgi:hypothetical protein